MKGTTPAAIADKLDLSRMTVSNVIHGRVTSRRVASAISAVVQKPLCDIWPGRYEPIKRAKTKRRAAR